MKTLNELYTIFYNKIKDKPCIYALCYEIGLLYEKDLITQPEYWKLFDHFKANKPTKDLHPEFIKSDTWNGSIWWWNDNENTLPIHRKAFVQKMKLITNPKSKFDDNITHCMGSFY